MGAVGDELRVGVIGVGVMGADHAERLAVRTEGARLVAVADPDVARARQLGDRLGARSGADALELVAADDVDAVVIASPGAAHEEQVLACLTAGKPVLCEKPLTLDADSSLRLVRAERDLGRRLVQVGFMRRFDPEFASLRESLVAGRLGRLLLLHNIHRNLAAPNERFRSEMTVLDSLVHEVDVARFLFGEEVASIQVLSPAATSAAPAGVVDPQVAIFTMAGGGVVTNEVFINSGVGYEVRTEAVGETGSVTVGTWEGTVPRDYRTRFAAAYDREVQAWVDANLRGEVVGPSMWDGYAASVVTTAGVESLRSGERVTVQLADPPTEGVVPQPLSQPDPRSKDAS